MFTLFFTVSNLISISLKFHPIASSRFFNRLSMATGPEEMCLSLEHQNSSKTSEKMGYFVRVAVSLVVSLHIL